MTTLRILGTGSFVPETVVSNRDFEAFLDTSDEWITTRTGMKRRHVSLADPVWRMGLIAAQRAMEAAGTAPADIGAVLVSTCTADYDTPSTAAILQRELGIPDAFAFDINVACAGFAMAMDLAWHYLYSGAAKKILVVGAEQISQYVDYTDRSMCILFGDGAGACVVEAGEGFYGSYRFNDTGGTHFIHGKRPRHPLPFSDGAEPPRADPFPMTEDSFMHQNGKEVYKITTRAVPEAVRKACDSAGIRVEELDGIVPHQANLRILETAAKNLGVGMDKFCVNIDECGNTSSASVPISLDDAVRAGRIKRGDKLCLVGFGAGISLVSVVFAY